jgi:hypothetical protein
MGVSALSRYYAGAHKKPGLLLSYGAASLDAIAASVDLLTPLLTAPALRPSRS